MDTKYLSKALEIAIQAHAGQFDKQGMPYVLHPLRVMLRMKNTDDMIVAILHDVVEDSDVTIDSLRIAGFSDEILKVIDILTHRPNEPYKDYVLRVKENPTATKIKLADLADNTDASRGEVPVNRINLYQEAIATLT